MKKRTLGNWVGLIILFSCTLAASSDIPIEIHGFVRLKENYLFSVRDASTNQSKWIGKNQSFNGLVIMDYNSNNSVVRGLYNGQKIRLSLVESKLLSATTKTTLNEEKSTTYSQEEINHLVNDFRRKEFAKLPNQEEPLYFALKQATENRIHSYKHYLLSRNQNGETSNLESAATQENAKPSNYKPRIGSQRTKNNVNSRIQSSDHIEQFGLPQT